jgi:two-component system, NtrC family, sensor kinase
MASELEIDDDARLRLLIQREALELLERAGLDVRVVLRARAGGDAPSVFTRIRGRLADVQERALAKMAALGLIGAGVTHEVKNVMTGVLGFAQIARRKWRDAPPEAAEVIATIERESARCVEVLHNFLHFTRKSEVRAPVVVALLVRSVAAVVEHRAHLHGVRVAAKQVGDVPAVMGDSGELRQVLLNLVLNALQASERGGEVRIVSGTDPDGWAVVRVSDDGRGIAPGDEERLFAPFFTTKNDGTGLGLYVSRGIVQEHGGTIAVASREGHGTTFTVRLPPVRSVG